MITASELAARVGRKISLNQLGPNRWQGLCPFHQEKTASFHIYIGRRGEGRFHCFGCGADGDGGDWARKVEGARLDLINFSIPPEIIEAQRQRRRRERALQFFLDHNPDTPLPPWL